MNSDGDIRELMTGESIRPGEIPLTQKQADSLSATTTEVRKQYYNTRMRSTKNSADTKRLRRVGR